MDQVQQGLYRKHRGSVFSQYSRESLQAVVVYCYKEFGKSF